MIKGNPRVAANSLHGLEDAIKATLPRGQNIIKNISEQNPTPLGALLSFNSLSNHPTGILMHTHTVTSGNRHKNLIALAKSTEISWFSNIFRRSFSQPLYGCAL